MLLGRKRKESTPGEGTVRICAHHVGKGLHSLRDNKVQGEGEIERGERGLKGFIWEQWKDPREEQKRKNLSLH